MKQKCLRNLSTLETADSAKKEDFPERYMYEISD